MRFPDKDPNYERRQSNLKVILTLATISCNLIPREMISAQFYLLTSFSSSEKLANFQ